MRKHAFDGSDPIKVFHFLTRFVSDAEMFCTSEIQAFIALTAFLADSGRTQYRTSLSHGSRLGGVTYWLKAVKYLLRLYAAATTMREALENLRKIRQQK